MPRGKPRTSQRVRGKIIFILGGARSGKSAFAVSLAKKSSKPVYFIATAKPKDREMKKRIQRHRNNRPASWVTLEPTRDMISVLEGIPAGRTAILDCLTLWISEMVMGKMSEKSILSKIKDFFVKARMKRLYLIVVSNEVGNGLVPVNPRGRLFRDIAGLVHQEVARLSQAVYQVTAGIPVRIK